MEQQQFNNNVSEWINVTNARMREMEEAISDIALSQEEDLMTLSYQYKILKDLRRSLIRLEKLIHNLEVKYQKYLTIERV